MIKVLIVDDEPDLDLLIQQRFRKKIQAQCYQFYFARDGEDALESLKMNPDIQLVATDLNMPNMNGLELLSHIRKLYPHIKTIIVSAYSDADNMDIAAEEGAISFIIKPINFDEFEERIQSLTLLAE